MASRGTGAAQRPQIDLSGPRSERIAVHGGAVAFDVIGAGPPLVLTHGTPSWSYLWRHVAPLLAETHTVYLWDLLGYGSSHMDPALNPSLSVHAETLLELCSLWGLERPILIGHDIGGGSTLRAHLLHHLDAAALVILDAAVFPPWIGPGTAHMQQHLAAYRSMPNGMFQQVIRAHFAETVHTPMAPSDVAAYLDLYASVEGQARWLRRTAGFTEIDTMQFLHLLPAVTVPTTVIWGAEDAWLPIDAGRRLAQAIPGSRLEVVPAAGHFVMEDAPTETAELIARSISGVDATAASRSGSR